jgi:hypothetical protein
MAGEESVWSRLTTVSGLDFVVTRSARSLLRR